MSRLYDRVLLNRVTRSEQRSKSKMSDGNMLLYESDSMTFCKRSEQYREVRPCSHYGSQAEAED